MSYIINKTDGSVLTEVVDGTIDQTATDLTLIGKNASSYGEAFNENFVRLLENFSNTSAPNNPIQGQLWFDTYEGRLKVYNGTAWVVSGGSIVASSKPSSLSQGDIWIDSNRKQMFFDIGGGETILAGPAWSALQGITGFEVIDVLDTNQNARTIAQLKIGGVVLGIFSSVPFVPYIDNYSLPGWEGNNFSSNTTYVKGDRVKYRIDSNKPPTLVYEALTAVPTGTIPTNADYWKQVTIIPGFNSGTLDNLKFDVTATTANALISDATGELKTSEDFLSTIDDSSMQGTLSILNSRPLILGAGSQTEINVSSLTFELKSNVSNQNYQISTKTGTAPPTAALFVDGTNEKIGLYTDTPAEVLDVNGNAIIRGDLTVEGTTTTINSTELVVDDLNITIASGAADSAAADGAGITVDGAGATFTYDNANSAWTSSEHLNLAANKKFKMAGNDVISTISGARFKLETSVETALGLTEIGTLDYLDVANISINNDTISSTGNMYLAPTGYLDVGGAIITNAGDPSPSTNQVVTTQYLETELDNVTTYISVDTSTLPGTPSIEDNIAVIVEQVFPAGVRRDGTECRVWCTDLNLCKLYFVGQSVSGSWGYAETLPAPSF